MIVGGVVGAIVGVIGVGLWFGAGWCAKRLAAKRPPIRDRIIERIEKW